MVFLSYALLEILDFIINYFICYIYVKQLSYYMAIQKYICIFVYLRIMKTNSMVNIFSFKFSPNLEKELNNVTRHEYLFN